MKKLLALGAAVALGLSSIGCGEPAAPVNSTPTPSVTPSDPAAAPDATTPADPAAPPADAPPADPATPPADPATPPANP